MFSYDKVVHQLKYLLKKENINNAEPLIYIVDMWYQIIHWTIQLEEALYLLCPSGDFGSSVVLQSHLMSNLSLDHGKTQLKSRTKRFPSPLQIDQAFQYSIKPMSSFITNYFGLRIINNTKFLAPIKSEQKSCEQFISFFTFSKHKKCVLFSLNNLVLLFF